MAVLFKSNKIKKIKIMEYYDSHGNEIDRGSKIINLNDGDDVEVIEEEVKFSFMDDTIIFWHLLVNGENLTKGHYEVTEFYEDRSMLVLRGCVGAG